jgi:hypothetical protein
MDNIYTASKPFVTLIQLLGIFPMSFVGPTRKGVFKVKLWNIAVTLIWFIGLMFVVMISFSVNNFEGEKSKVLPYAWKVSINLEVLSYIVMAVHQLLSCRKIVKFLAKIDDCDQKVSGS